MREASSARGSEDLSSRESLILEGLLATYLSTGQPVGSRAIADLRADSPSAATIRHVLAELEGRGFLVQPHTSAGRVPTARALRWYLGQLHPPAPVALAEEAQRLERALRAAKDDAELCNLASEYLSNAIHQVGVVAVRAWQDAGLKHLRFFRLTDHRVLAILVAADGQVRERVGRVPSPYTQAELDEAARYFNHHFAGFTLARMREEMTRRLEAEREAYNHLLRRVLVLTHCGVLEMQNEGEVYIQGAAHLAAACEGERLESVLERLHQKERWLRLLGDMDRADAVAVDAGPAPVRVRVGLDDESMPGFALVAVQHPQGALGILGTTCMPYARAYGAVALVRDLFHKVLGEGV